MTDPKTRGNVDVNPIKKISEKEKIKRRDNLKKQILAILEGLISNV